MLHHTRTVIAMCMNYHCLVLKCRCPVFPRLPQVREASGAQGAVRDRAEAAEREEGEKEAGEGGKAEGAAADGEEEQEEPAGGHQQVQGHGRAEGQEECR